jgi:hypothetical protein
MGSQSFALALLAATLCAGCSSQGDAPEMSDPGPQGVGGSGGSETVSAGTGGSPVTSSGGHAGASGASGHAAMGGSAGSGGAQPEGGSSGGSGSARPPDDVCVTADGCTPGKWINVTPAKVSLTAGGCGNFGAKTVQTDALHPEALYTLFFCQGIFKSTDYGQTWNGPINTGSHAAEIVDCAGGIAISRKNTASPPTLYASCIRGSGLGFWKSVNGGVDWTPYKVAPAADVSLQQFYAPAIDPYDPDHLLMAGHAVDVLVESTDGGKTWNAITTAPGMKQNGGTGGIDFIDTGDAATTRTTWLWLAAQSGGGIGTWRTTKGGADWTRVETNEHTNGSSQIFQPDTGGVVFMAGVYSKLGGGVLRSPDYGVTWTHVGQGSQEAIVFGTSKNLYSMFGWGIGAGGMVDPVLEVSPIPGTGAWSKPGTPAAMTQGPAQAAVTNDGKNSIIVTASYNAGLWRYVEP